MCFKLWFKWKKFHLKKVSPQPGYTRRAKKSRSKLTSAIDLALILQILKAENKFKIYKNISSRFFAKLRIKNSNNFWNKRFFYFFILQRLPKRSRKHLSDRTIKNRNISKLIFALTFCSTLLNGTSFSETVWNIDIKDEKKKRNSENLSNVYVLLK